MTLSNRSGIRNAVLTAFHRSRRSGRSDAKVILEEIVDQLVMISDEHRKQIAVMRAEFDADIAALRREMDSHFDDLKADSAKNNVVPLR
jgi:hypothetical protein